MTTVASFQSSLSRPAPIPIAPAPPYSESHIPSKGRLQLQRTHSMASPTPVTPPTAEAPSAQSRRDRPCDACRRRKSRCVVQEGAHACLLCEFQKQACTFLHSPQPRKRRRNSDENSNGRTKRSNRSPGRCPSPPNSNTGLSEAASASNGERSSQPAHHRASDGLDTRIDRQVQHIGQSGEFEHRLLELSKFDGDDQSPTSRGILRRVNDHDTFLVLPGQSTSLDRDEIVLLHAIESVVAPHGPALIETFFSIVHPSFPILRAQSFLGNGKGSAQETAPPALLGAIYILSLGWWSHKSEEDRLIRPDMNELKRLTSRSLDIAVHRPRLSTIQAGLLLLQVSDQDSWPLTAQLVAIGQGLGLHLDSSNWRISQEERALRRRLAWALFMQDKWSALIHGRPSHIVQSSWSVKPVTDEDFADIIVQQDREDSNNDEKEKSMMLFGHMIPLTEILSDVLDTFYTLQAIDEIENAGSNGTKMILERAKPIQIKLKDWFARLPACLRMDSITPNQLSSTGYLHLAYFATEITLHRRIVRSLNPGATDAYLMHICRSAAKTRLISAMDFINRMKPEHLQSFWYFSSKISFALIGTFGGLLLATAPSKEEAEFYRRRLSEYRWTLTVSSKSASFMRFAVEMLDTSTGFLENLEKKPSISWQQTNMAGSIANDEAMMDAPHFHLFSESGKPDPMDHLLLDPPSGASGLASPSTSTSSRFSEQDGYPAPMKGFELRRAQEETFDFFARPGS